MLEHRQGNENWYVVYSETIRKCKQLIEAGGTEDLLQVQGLSTDGLNNSKDTVIQEIE